MSRSTKLLTFSAALLAPWLLTSAVAQVFSPTAAITVGDETAQPLNSFDISFVEPAIGLYVLGDRTNNAIDMVDTHSNAFLGFCGHNQFQGAVPNPNGTINNNVSGPNGVLIRDNREIWAGDGDSTVKVFDVAGCGETTVPSHTIPTGTPADKRADEMCYDPVDQIIMVANNAADTPFATLISTIFYVKLVSIPFPQSTNGAEQCQWNPVTGLFYITIPGIETPDNGHGQVVVINPGTLMVDARSPFDIPLTACASPQGLAVGPGNDMLVGCNGNGSATQSSVIIGAGVGQLLATIPNQSGPDEVWFNPGNLRYFLARSNAGSGFQALGIIDAGARVANIPPGIQTGAPVNNPPSDLHPSAHSVAADSVTGKTFWPIPANPPVGGGPQGDTPFGLCSFAGGDDTKGCILVVEGFVPVGDPTANASADPPAGEMAEARRRRER